MSSTNPLRDIMDANYLTSLNFIDLLKNLNLLLKSENIAYVLEGDGSVELASDVWRSILVWSLNTHDLVSKQVPNSPIKGLNH